MNRRLQWFAGYFPALQSRGGDGFSHTMTANAATYRLPEREVRDYCDERSHLSNAPSVKQMFPRSRGPK